jgi:hypothetical protein
VCPRRGEREGAREGRLIEVHQRASLDKRRAFVGDVAKAGGRRCGLGEKGEQRKIKEWAPP